jgi:hypothetical protein
MGETRLLFPEAAKKISFYIIFELKGKISKAILEMDGSIENIAKMYNLDPNDLVSSDEESCNLDFMKLIEIDTILIATRHLFRMPYSFNEKSGLVSLPFAKQKIEQFEKHWAKPHFVKPEFNKHCKFLGYDPQYGRDADILLIKAYEDDYLEKVSESVSLSLKQKGKNEFTLEITEEIPIKDFPQSIQFVLGNNFMDGKKRALFLLLTFLKMIKYSDENVERTIAEWNEKQSEPLKENYIAAQVSWFKNLTKELNPPNFDNDNYYKNIGIPNEVMEKDRKAFKKNVKSPLQYVAYYLNSKKK